MNNGGANSPQKCERIFKVKNPEKYIFQKTAR